MNAYRLFMAVAGFAAFFAGNASAACPTFHTLANGTTADATQVMDNFDYILQCPNFTGNVGIGGLSSSMKLYVTGTNGNQVSLDNDGSRFTQLSFDHGGSQKGFLALDNDVNAIVLGGQGGNTGSRVSIRADGGTDAFNVTYAGNVGIGTTSPSEPLEVNGLVKIDSFGSATATPVCELSGVLSLCSSSLRYKEDVKTASFGLSEVMQMRPVTFKWKGRSERDIGLLAEEVAKIDPLFVTYKNGAVEGVKYAQLTAVLINAVKQLEQTSDTQAVQIAALQRELSGVKRSIGMRTAQNRSLRHRAQRS